jgi:hypothetical protein
MTSLTGGELEGTCCRLLLTYTYAWDLDPDTPPDELVAWLEPADLAVAQRVVLAAAAGRGVRVLDRLVQDRDDPAPIAGFRAELDRVRTIYHRLDAYRYDSSQRSRAVYLAARREMDLDAVHERTEVLLSQVAESLTAAGNARAIRFDRTLNRIVGALAIVTAGVFVLDLLLFMRAGEPLAMTGRLVTLGAILSASLVGLAALFATQRRPT